MKASIALLVQFRHHDRVAYAITEWLSWHPFKCIRLGRAYGMGWPAVRRTLFRRACVYPLSLRCFNGDRFFGT